MPDTSSSSLAEDMLYHKKWITDSTSSPVTVGLTKLSQGLSQVQLGKDLWKVVNAYVILICTKDPYVILLHIHVHSSVIFSFLWATFRAAPRCLSTPLNGHVRLPAQLPDPGPSTSKGMCRSQRVRIKRCEVRKVRQLNKANFFSQLISFFYFSEIQKVTF